MKKFDRLAIKKKKKKNTVIKIFVSSIKTKVTIKFPKKKRILSRIANLRFFKVKLGKVRLVCKSSLT